MELEDQTLREAFQIQTRPVAPSERLRVLEALLEAGVRRFQLGSLVRADRMPQMAHIEQLFTDVRHMPGLEIWAMVFNFRGLQRAMDCGITHVALSASLSPIHSQRNLRCSVEHGMARCRDMAAEALAQGLTVRMGLQCAFGGPMLTPPEAGHIFQWLLPFYQMGVQRLALADTAGRATPAGIEAKLEYLREALPGAQIGLHLHGDQERLAGNLEAAWSGGAAWLDATLMGRGGCPFLAGRPPANLPLSQAVEFLAGKGVDVDLELAGLAKAEALLSTILSNEKVIVGY
ncbi:hydroxymethylglutaryl-CoA lyase [Desulfoferula mesophila]|uniref:Hydroxymethylglutaryl-CoA lyase n=2 Tax=Desulfoferula mesophila TaxID=3058419 RepID=A0AAU9E9Y2_9BACT|nr:hydroxymethylglutaryl-CoA lyase [Desulfoferula mesophilus]